GLLLFAFSIRLGYWYFPEGDLIFLIFGAPILALPVFFVSRLYHSVVRFIGVKSLITIIQSVSLYAAIWGLMSYMTNIEGVPRSVILINWMLCIIFITGSRLIARWLFTYKEKIDKNNIIIYGAGSAGRELSHALGSSKSNNHLLYIDDNPLLDGSYINNVPIFVTHKISKLITKYSITEVLVAIPSASRKRRREILDSIRELPVRVRCLPSISQLTHGRIKENDLLEIEISDLLGRQSVLPNEDLLKIKIYEKVVLITGAGGSIGSELARQIIFLKPKKIILFDHSESSLYEIDKELRSHKVPTIEIIPILGSINSDKKLENICNHFQVQTIYHAAAYKHVPLVEFNTSSGVQNNVIGTLLSAKAAISAKVETFVLISSDKAVRPTNIMGAAKRCSELILQSLSSNTHSTIFSMVRFGNVLDSSGSVIPLFKEQIKLGGPVTVTDINIVRYFMTIPEAVELVIQAGAIGSGGEVFVLDMGKPIKIYDLAKKMIELSGLKVIDKENPSGDIEIIFTGLRPGEKLFEELLMSDSVIRTDNKLIMRARESMIEWEELEPILGRLNDACLKSDHENIRNILKELVPEFNPQSPIVDLLYKK
ncbi:polysaccharide biosynthesis protein, partial [Candidatus Pseudothioglobus singularis]|nr:polysaccharide biosynthesis protein [Candidatus Pseudothioglobus singularis]